MTKFIAEFTTNHMGNLNVLLKMVEEAKKAGADLIKMQKKDVESFYSQEKLDSPFDSPYGHTYKEYRKIFEFGLRDFDVFDRKCTLEGIDWFSTVQDIQSLDFFERYFNLPVYKVASSNAKNKELLEEVSKTAKWKQIIISVAGCSFLDIEKTLKFFPKHDIVLQHCVAEYPCPAENLHYGNIGVLIKEFQDDRIKIGYSGHEIGESTTIALADRYKLETIERHFCLSRHSFVHHIECSLEPNEFKHMVNEIRYSNVVPSIDERAWKTSFGMSDVEKEFLENKKYGNTYLGKRSTWER